jgi:hypothetical protein
MHEDDGLPYGRHPAMESRNSELENHVEGSKTQKV